MQQLWFILAFVATLVSASPQSTQSTEPKQETSKDFVLALQRDGFTLITTTEPGEVREQRMREFLGKYFNLDKIARYAAGRHWRSFSQEEKVLYRELFERYIIAVYAPLVASHSGKGISTKNKILVGKKITVFKNKAGAANATHVNVTWRLEESGDSFKVLDVAVENVSILITMRSGFNSVISRNGVGGFLKELEKKVETLNAK